MVSRSKIAVIFPAGSRDPSWPPCGISTVETLADWLDAKYHQLITWTGYDPAMMHGRVLVFERFQNDDPIYDPNTRRVNLPLVNLQGKPWLHTQEFVAYCLHETVHDFTRWDEQY